MKRSQPLQKRKCSSAPVSMPISTSTELARAVLAHLNRTCKISQKKLDVFTYHISPDGKLYKLTTAKSRIGLQLILEEIQLDYNDSSVTAPLVSTDTQLVFSLTFPTTRLKR